ADVLNIRGELDFSQAEFERLQPDWVIASIHSDTLQPGEYTQEDFNQLWLNIAQNPYVDMIGHSESKRYRYDYDALAPVFARNHKVVELNANSVNVRPGGEANMKELALACKRAGTKVAVNSDGHSIYHLGRVEHILNLLREIDFPQELVVNASMETLVQVLHEHKKPVAAVMEV
ncbi:MAG: phosphatase, partial [Ruthenibacterium sp.]